MSDAILFVSNPQDKPPARNIKQGARHGAQKPPKKITSTYLHNAGLAYLQRFPSSVTNFKRVMGQKIKKSCNYHKDQDLQTCMELLDTVVGRFKDQGLLDDTAYLRGMVHSLRGRGLSAQAMTFKLIQKGLPASAIKEYLTADEGGSSSVSADLKAALVFCHRKRIGPFSKTPWDTLDPKDRLRQLSALARAGHGADIAKKALMMPLDEAQEFLSLY